MKESITKFFHLLLFSFLIIKAVKCQCQTASSIIAFSEGVASGIPDTATLHILITNSSSTATSVTRNIRQVLNQILRIADWNGIPISNIETLNVNLAPITKQSRTVGFQANQTIVIKAISITSPVSSLIAILYEHLSKLSGLILSGLHFEYSNIEEVKDRARRYAYNMADSYIQTYSMLAGFSKQNLIEVEEQPIVLSNPNRFNLTEMIGFKEADPGVFIIKIETKIKYGLL